MVSSLHVITQLVRLCAWSVLYEATEYMWLVHCMYIHTAMAGKCANGGYENTCTIMIYTVIPIITSWLILFMFMHVNPRKTT